MDTIDGDLILNKEKRKSELSKIRRFISQMPKEITEFLTTQIGPVTSYLTFHHFIAANHFSKEVNTLYPIGYNSGKVGFIYLPTSVYPDLDRQLSVETTNVYRCNKIIRELKKKGVEDWIIDLRGNSGGELLSFISYVIQLLPDEIEIKLKGCDNTVIKIMGDRLIWGNKVENIVNGYLPTDEKIKYNSIKVLMNKYSFSASEFMAYMLKKYSGAIICGTDETGGALTTVVSLDTSIGMFDVPYCYVEKNSKSLTPDTGIIPDI